MSAFDQISRRAAALTVTGAAAVTFAALTALTGVTDTPVTGTPQAATVPVVEADRTAPPRTVTQPPTQDVVPAQPDERELSDAMRAQGERAPVPAASPAAAASSSGGESLAEQVGRMMITGYAGAYPDARTLTRIRRGQVGGVILMGENVGARTSEAVSAMQAAARQAGRTLMIATDQEGGDVKRFAGAPSTAAAQMRSAAAARAQGTATGRMLRSFGVNTDFAPVADVAHPGTFLGSRAFGSSATQVAQRACAFAAGLQSVGVNATLKHFPGLGYAAANTDTAAETVSQPAAALDRDLLPYRRCKPALVMLSNAVYPAYDPGTPAVFSSRIVDGLLRGRLGYTGVVVSDSLTATSVTSSTTAVRAAKAGVDMLLYIPADVSARAYENVLAAVRRGDIPRERVRSAAARVRALTER